MQTARPKIAVTFDDGPHLTNTLRILDSAAACGIKLTFFVVGNRIEQTKDVLARQVAEGHEIGNHSWSHRSFAKLTNGEVESELNFTNDAIWNAAKVRPTLFRPPYGIISLEQRELISKRIGQRITLWNIDPRDWQKPGAEVVEARIETAIKPSAIILLHDIYSATSDAAPRIFDTLLRRGYDCVTVSNLLQK